MQLLKGPQLETQSLVRDSGALVCWRKVFGFTFSSVSGDAVV